ncbi:MULTISPECIES: inositol monophosphatase family protein [unclassified Pseudoclavibacter]|uniref:inositol monophosphatase family protein n=1 Tax=unclassified Pseudoclavibacter TaxID=2615177 RepID=UPI0021586B48|nr:MULTISPECIES: inositol monophosphatase family protein [unclassified Pseudoclavibacter]
MPELDDAQTVHDADQFTPEELRGLLDIAVTVATEAAELVAVRRREGVAVADTKSSSVDIVTASDRESEAHIRRRLEGLRPGDGFFGEESDASASTTGLTWVVDPIDGTVNYLYGYPNYAVSVAVVVGDPGSEPSSFTTLAAAVVNPEGREAFTAVRGQGAWCNGERLHVDAAPPLELALVGTGFSYSAKRRVQQAEQWMTLAGRVRDLRRVGAASLDLCNIAINRLDAYYESGLNSWDHAGAALVAREAGAVVVGEGLGREGRRLIIAARPGLEQELMRYVSVLADE